MKKFVSLSLMLSLGLAIISPALNAAQSPAATAKQKAMARFNTSLNRFKKCYQNPKSCSRMDALKIARDLGIAAVALVTAAYVTGGALKLGVVTIPVEYQATKPVRSALKATYHAGEALQKPAGAVINPLKIQSLIASGKIPKIGSKLPGRRQTSPVKKYFIHDGEIFAVLEDDNLYASFLDDEIMWIDTKE